MNTIVAVRVVIEGATISCYLRSWFLRMLSADERYKASSLCVDVVISQYLAQLEEYRLIDTFRMMEYDREEEGGAANNRKG